MAMQSGGPAQVRRRALLPPAHHQVHRRLVLRVLLHQARRLPPLRLLHLARLLVLLPHHRAPLPALPAAAGDNIDDADAGGAVSKCALSARIRVIR